MIIAAYESSQTIGRAVRSALSQTEVREVIVVDDASNDGTAARAAEADDGSGRLTIMVQNTNCGPAAARNRAIDLSRSAYLAVLDADDYLLPNRFRPLFDIPAWDMIADNIAFLSEDGTQQCGDSFHRFELNPIRIGLAQFIEGNISRPRRPRAELGFVKPVIRREFLERTGARYDESLRLGEDYALYALLLVAGARFVCCKPCGYVATERIDSLSSRHNTSDLEALLAFDERLSHYPQLSVSERRAIGRHRDQVQSKFHHRRVLDRRQEGLLAALRTALAYPALLPQLSLSVARDKLRRAPAGRPEVRYLFN